MQENINFTYKSKDTIRLDIYLSKELKTTRSFINKLIKDKKIYVNKLEAKKPSYLLKNNDFVEAIFQEEKRIDTNDNIKIRFDIIYEDDYFMVINKPKGLICHESSFHEQDTLVKEIELYYNSKNYEFDNIRDLRNGLVHRLDKKTSGLLLVAKKRDIFNILKQEIEKKNIKKYYYALVLNSFDSNVKEFKIDLPIDHNNKNTKMVISPSGKKAVTFVKVLDNFKKYALVECDLQTGRTHQIRIHLSAINHAIYNDGLYGKKIDDDGQYLFAYKIKLVHPITKKDMEFEIKKDELLLNKIKEIKGND